MRKQFKIAIIEAELKHQPLAVAANKHLCPDHRLSELNITQIITERKKPTPEQAEALARVLGCSASELFHTEGAS